jgi:hypothetical protein
MIFRFVVDVEVEKESGKFASRDEIAEKLIEAITDADPQQIDTDNDALYNTTNWDVQEDSK